MSSWPDDIAAMHKKYGFDKMLASDLNKDFLNFRAEFLQEEVDEITKGIDNNHAGEVVDGLIDLCVVAIGTLDLYGVDAQCAWDEVRRANLQKTRGIKPGRESNGWDLVKDIAWQPPFHGGNTGSLPAALEPGDVKSVVQSELFRKEELVASREEKTDGYEKTFAMTVLDAAIDLQKRKGNDYQNAASKVRQANHYPRGVLTIADMVWQKLMRIYSLLETAEAGGATSSNFEGVGDSCLDAINYLSFLISYYNEKMDGQDPNRDMFNRERK